jgi:hypothetical protein
MKDLTVELLGANHGKMQFGDGIAFGGKVVGDSGIELLEAIQHGGRFILSTASFLASDGKERLSVCDGERDERLTDPLQFRLSAA